MPDQEMVEDWIASGKSRFWIENRLTTHGVPSEEVDTLIDAAEAGSMLKKQRRLAIFRCVGIAMLLLGGSMVVWGLFFVDGWTVVSGVSVAVALAGLIVTFEPSALEHLNRMFGR